MDKLFIDTNVFESKGFNFDEQNVLIKVLTDNIKTKKYEYCNLTVIDSEIKSHINERSNELKKVLDKKYKWIKNYVDEDIVYNNCYKDLIDYEKFKKVVGAINCDISQINSEKIFERYFSEFI